MKLKKMSKKSESTPLLFILKEVSPTDRITAKAMADGMLYTLTIELEEARKVMEEKYAGRVLALRDAKWPLADIAKDAKISVMEAAKVIYSARQYPSLVNNLPKDGYEGEDV